MNGTRISNVIGIDGGGTACKVAAVIEGRRFEATVGPANVSSDFDGAMAAISNGLSAVAKNADVSLAKLLEVPAYLGLAGTTDKEMRFRVLREVPLVTARAGDDRRTTLTGALGRAEGAVLSVGTGSFVAAYVNRHTYIKGGHGFLVGDEASGAWLGRKLLQRCLHVLDRIEEPSPLVQRTIKGYNESKSEISGFASEATPAEFAELAPGIVAAASEGDEFAKSLMVTGARYLERCLGAAKWNKDLPLCLMGGLGTGYRPFLSSAIVNSIIKPEGTALDGALTLAAEFAADLRRYPE